MAEDATLSRRVVMTTRSCYDESLRLSIDHVVVSRSSPHYVVPLLSLRESHSLRLSIDYAVILYKLLNSYCT